jgi:hypothetical protein
MLATIQQNSNGVYQAAPGWSARLGHADEAGTVAGRAANAVALICYGCSNCHLSLLCYPLPGTDREPSDRPIGRLPEGSGDPPASTSAHEAGALDAASLIHFDVTGLLAWWRGQPGQVGNEAATAVFRQCRGSGSSPSPFSCFSRILPCGVFACPQRLQTPDYSCRLSALLLCGCHRHSASGRAVRAASIIASARLSRLTLLIQFRHDLSSSRTQVAA